MPLNRISHIYTIYSPHEYVKPVLHRIHLGISTYPSEYQPWWSWARFFPTRKCLCASTFNGNKYKLTAVTLTSQLRFSQYINSSWITPVSDFTSLLKTASGKAFLQTSHEIFLPCVSFSSLTGESWSFGGAERRCRLRNLGGNIGRTHDVITAGQRHTNAWLISSFSVELRYRVRYSADLPVSTAVYAFLCSPRDFFQYPSICWQLCARVLFMIRKYLLNQSMAPHNVYCLVYLLMTHIFTLSLQEWFSLSVVRIMWTYDLSESCLLLLLLFLLLWFELNNDFKNGRYK